MLGIPLVGFGESLKFFAHRGGLAYALLTTLPFLAMDFFVCLDCFSDKVL